MALNTTIFARKAAWRCVKLKSDQSAMHIKRVFSCGLCAYMISSRLLTGFDKALTRCWQRKEEPTEEGKRQSVGGLVGVVGAQAVHGAGF